MKILCHDDEKYIKCVSRYDLNYWITRNQVYLQVTNSEFEMEIDKIVGLLISNNIFSLEILSFSEKTNLSNLNKLSFVSSLTLSGGQYSNTNSFQALTNLSRLRIWNENREEAIDVSVLKKLERIEILNRFEKIIGVSELKNLKNLCIQKYNRNCLTEFVNLTELESIEFIQSKFICLKGIEEFKKLKCVTIFYARKIECIDSLESLNKLEYLEFRNCSKISDYSIIGKLCNLKVLTLLTCSTIKNLDWLANCKKLEWASIMETDVANGKIDNLITVPHHAYTNKKHFNYFLSNGIDIKK